MMTVKAIAIIGHHDAGKTTFLTRLIPALTARDYRVGCVKHVAPDVELDTPGKDSYLLAKAGAKRTLVYSDVRGALLWDHPGEPVDMVLARHFSDLDLILLEGFKDADLPKIEVYSSGEPLAGRIPVLAVVASGSPRVPDGVPVLPPDPDIVADFLEAEVL